MEPLLKEELWERAASGDARANEVLERQAVEVARDELRRRGAPADELDSLAFLSYRSVLGFMKRGGSIRSNLRAFMKYRARGILSDYRRKARIEEMETTLDGVAPPSSAQELPEHAASRLELADALRACCERLKGRLAAVLDMRHCQGLETREIAERLEISPGTVHVHMFRAAAQVRQCLERKGFQDWHLDSEL